MIKTTSVFARVEPQVKEQAEKILNELGIPMSNAIGAFLRQIVMRRGIPFEMQLPAIRMPLDISKLTEDQFYDEIEKGFGEVASGKSTTLEEVEELMNREYGI